MNNKTWIMAFVGMSLVASCAEKERILPGPREDLVGAATTERVENAAPAISLPAQTRNNEWTHRIGTPKYRVANAALSPTPSLVWETSIGKGESRKSRITADPVVAQGRIYTVDSESTLTATSLNGAELWTRDLATSRDKAGEASTGGIAYDGGKLFVTTGFGSLRAFDATTGADLWEQRFQAVGSGTPTVYGDLVYAVSGDATAWAMNTTTGKVDWQLLSIPDVQNVQSPSAPAINDRLAIIAYGSGEIQGAFRRGGVGRWNSSISGQRLGRATNTIADISGDPVIVGNSVYVANHSGRLVALDVNTGARLWTLGEGSFNPVFPAGGSLFMVSDENKLMRINASDGKIIWQQNLPLFVKNKPTRQAAIFAHYGPILAGGRLFVASSDEMLRAFDPQSGALVYSVELPGGAASNPVVAGGVLYVVNTKGKLLAFR
ncbi:PQQ-binding-like beta-propeller repeat protein [Shimia abyssi]|uniref:Outer membrane protein assembly factor BamB n=1 Tax=Shimia abyssi TaxID=1662395 RepID=A0A2P8FIY6_9RHOB|nr:PQQ-binding-like beta-propeller repeat protein [Shimia abyssi]PSL21680.1 outer membrane protein assembly factor BamB [Shimia abyssi]